MTSPIFIDANIPMYAAGAEHALKNSCEQVLQLAADRPHAFVTDAEVLQELLHRYLAVRLWPGGRVVIRGFARLMRGRIEPIYGDDSEAAASLVEAYPGMSARDLLHCAHTVYGSSAG